MSSSDPSADPKIWGPALWKFLHSMAANYPVDPNPQYRASSRQFFYALRHLLPCEMCRLHYSALIGKRQPQTESAQDLQEWVLWLHNEVNHRIKPGQPGWTLDQLEAVYKADVSETSSQNPPLSSPAHPGAVHVNSAELPFNSVQRILKPLEDLHTMLFNDSNSSPRSKPLLSARQLHSKLVDARRGSQPESALRFSPDRKLPVSLPPSQMSPPPPPPPPPQMSPPPPPPQMSPRGHRRSRFPSPRHSAFPPSSPRLTMATAANVNRSRKGSRNPLQMVAFRSNHSYRGRRLNQQHSTSNSTFGAGKVVSVATTAPIAEGMPSDGESKKDCGCKK